MAVPTVVGTGRTLGVSNATSEAKFVTFNYISTVATQKAFIAPFALRLVAIHGVTRVAGSGGACTFSFFKAADTVAVGSGTLLHSGTFDLTATADTNQYMTLVTSNDSLTFAPGDAIGVALTGTATSAIGSVTFTLEPVN